MQPLNPGDVILVRTPAYNWLQRLIGRLIRLGAALEDKPNLVNHVAIVWKTDLMGVLWCIEAQAGGVGQYDVARYDNMYLVSNAAEVKTDAQRAEIVRVAEAMLGTSYDWEAIGVDAAEALHLGALWKLREWSSRPPAHVVCSSLADYVYDKVGLAHPGDGRLTTPADWYELFLAKGWA
jgi:hypothetical protein